MCSSWGVDDERKGDRSVFGTMANGSQGFASTDDPGADAPGAGAVVRHLVAGPGLEGIGHGSGAGTGPAHHRTMGGGLWCGRAQSPDLRADWWFPPALGEAQRATLKEAVQELPEAAGSGFANWNWKGVHQFVWEQFGLSLRRSSPDLPAPLGICLQAPQEATAEGGCGETGGLRGGVRRPVGGGPTD